jgi:hypothetical protein
MAHNLPKTRGRSVDHGPEWVTYYVTRLGKPALTRYAFFATIVIPFNVQNSDSGQTSHPGKQGLNDWVCPGA